MKKKKGGNLSKKDESRNDVRSNGSEDSADSLNS